MSVSELTVGQRLCARWIGAYPTAEPSRYAPSQGLRSLSTLRRCNITRGPLRGPHAPCSIVVERSLFRWSAFLSAPALKLLHTHMNPRADCPPGRPSHLMRRQPHMLQRYAYVRVRGREFTQNTTSQNLTQRHGCLAPRITLSASEPMT